MTAVEKAHDFLEENGIDRKDTIRTQFAAEEVLITYQHALGEEASVQMFLEKRMGRFSVSKALQQILSEILRKKTESCTTLCKAWEQHRHGIIDADTTRSFLLPEKRKSFLHLRRCLLHWCLESDLDFWFVFYLAICQLT